MTSFNNEASDESNIIIIIIIEYNQHLQSVLEKVYFSIVHKAPAEITLLDPHYENYCDFYRHMWFYLIQLEGGLDNGQEAGIEYVTLMTELIKDDKILS